LSTYYVTWSNDGRSGPTVTKIRGTGVGTDGAVGGLSDISAVGTVALPSVAATGRSAFLVTWTNWGEGRIQGKFIRGGVPGIIDIANGPASFSSPVVAVGGGTTFVFWDRAGDIVGARLASDGTVLDPDPRMVSLGPNPPGPPASASNGSVTFVAWRADDDRPSEVRATRVGADGTSLDPQGLTVASGDALTGKPAVASDGEDFLVAYNSAAPGGGCRVWAVRYSGSTGGQLGPVTTDLSSCITPSVAFDGTNYLIVAGGDSGAAIRAAVVSPAGAAGASFQVAAPPVNADGVAAAGAGGTSLVAWNDGAAVVGSGGTVTPVALPATIPSGPTTVASDGTGFLLTRTTSTGFVSTRIGADGSVLDPAGIVVSGEGGAPSVAFNGSWLLVWNDRRTTGPGPGAYGARIRSNGTVVDPQGFVIAAGADGDPAVSAREAGQGWTVAYADHDPATQSDRMFARQVAPK
jgi:hypothetical protein